MALRVLGPQSAQLPLFGGSLLVATLDTLLGAASARGVVEFAPTLRGLSLHQQVLTLDAAAPGGVALTPDCATVLQ